MAVHVDFFSFSSFHSSLNGEWRMANGMNGAKREKERKKERFPLDYARFCTLYHCTMWSSARNIMARREFICYVNSERTRESGRAKM